MAEEIPFNIVAHVLTKLGSSAIQQIGSAFGVAKQLTKLTNKLDTITGVLLDAEEKQEKSQAIKAWVRRLKGVVYDADDLLDDFETLQLQRGGVARQVSDFFSSSNQLVFRFKMSNRVKAIFEEVDEIVKEIPLLNLIQGSITHGEAESSWRETHSFALASEIVGREENKEKIIKSLVSSDNQEILSMVAIVGIGGLGKTTLAQLVYNDKEVVQYFEPRIWVCVSENFDVKSLVKKILKEVCEQDVERLELNGLKNLLHEKLSQKRCLLVLDDVWNENSEKWDQLKSLLMVVGKGSKVLVTTRHSKVALIMGINSPFFLEGLKETQPWDLFSKIAFTEEPEKVNPQLVEIGKEIVNMCNGVPLIIKTLGTILRLKTEESQWLSIKNNENLLSLGGGNDNVLSVLKLSYDNLPFPLKRCFAYCALFPKDYEIGKKLLVQLWMAQGYIQPLDENVGHQYFEELLSRSLLEEFEKDASNNILSCKMHDLIHDLAQLVMGSEVLILKDDAKEISKEVHHVSLFKSMNLKLKALKVKHIRTFLNIPIHYNYEDVSIQSFSSFKCLRVLSLDKFKVEKVPKSLGNLSHLRYLDLSNNWFKVLPNSITRLKNLQTLKLVGCSDLKKFPKDIRELIHLRHLENHDCGLLSHMPCGIGELTLLQSLPVFVVGNIRNGRGVGRLSELKGLSNLRGELSIVNLENARDVAIESRDAILGGKQHIQSLRLIWRSGAQSCEDAESVLEGLQPHSNLKQLYVEDYGGGRFPSWMMNGGLSSMLPNLTTVNLVGCSRCQILPCFVRLPHLKSLELHYMKNVEYMEQCSSEGPFFPSLQYLKLGCMRKLKELWRRDVPTRPPPSFPCLSELRIMDCDELASLELHSSPLLSKLEIFICPKLTSLQLPPSPLLSQLDIRSCGDLASLELHSSPGISIIEIIFCPKLTSLQVPPSPLLSQLHINYCYELASLELHSSPLLSSLKIRECPKLTSLQLPPSPLLSQLDIRSCGDLASLELHSSPGISIIEIIFCPKLTSLQVPPSPLLSQLHINYCYELASLELHSSPLLSSLKIRECPKLTSLQLPPSPLLSQLDIRSCGDLASLELHSSPGISIIEIIFCPKLTSLQVPPSPLLSQLDIENCDELASLELHSSPLLSSLKIRECPKLTSLQLPPSPLLSQLNIHSCGDLAFLELHLSPRLSIFGICECPKLTSLKLPSLPCLEKLELNEVKEVVLRELMLLATASSLESLCIRRIDDMMSFPDELHQHVSNLQTLQIYECFRLSTLPHWIGNLTSLTHLEIGSCPQLTSLPEELRSLRILKSLIIHGWSGLTTLPDWIDSLSSLEYLRIHSCPQLTSLPEEMRSLTTLQRLEIFRCPHLSERCQRENGEDWPKIAHVPDISIY